MKNTAKFNKVIILDSVILYPEHRALLNTIAKEVVEYPSSLPENLEKQYENEPEKFKNIKCYTELPQNNHSLQLLMNRVEGADVIISCWTNIPDQILRLNPQLKLIVFWTHEKEHRINVSLAEQLGIVVTNIPDYGTDAVAEAVFTGMWTLLLRNYPQDKNTITSESTANAITANAIEYYRMLAPNEKYTRSGKFTHHFHKLGLVEWNFEKKSLDEMIPEKLIESKPIGLLNIKESSVVAKMLMALNAVPSVLEVTDESSATIFKLLAENDIVYYDRTRTPVEMIEKGNMMFPDKLVAIQDLPSTTYSFTGKKFGVVGMGRIGARVASIARKLGLTVVYASKNRKQDLEKNLGIEPVSLPELMATCDVVSIHVPAHRAEGLITKQLIDLMKPGSLFINTADGNAVDQSALTERMTKNEVFAFLDVYAGLPRKDIIGLPMVDKTDWKVHKELANHVIAYRSGWKTQESIRVKTFKLLGEMIKYLPLQA